MAYPSQPQQPVPQAGSIFNIFFKQPPAPQPQLPRAATLQRKPLDAFDCTLEKLDSGVDRKRARLRQLENERAQAAQQAVAYKRAGQSQQALKAAQQVRDYDKEILQLEQLMGRLKLETRQLNYAKEASDTNALIKEAVSQKTNLLHGLDVTDVEDTAEASGVANDDLERIFDRLAAPLDDPQQAGYENEQLLQQLELDAARETNSAVNSNINSNSAPISSSVVSRGGTSSMRSALSLDADLPF